MSLLLVPMSLSIRVDLGKLIESDGRDDSDYLRLRLIDLGLRLWTLMNFELSLSRSRRSSTPQFVARSCKVQLDLIWLESDARP